MPDPIPYLERTGWQLGWYNSITLSIFNSTYSTWNNKRKPWPCLSVILVGFPLYAVNQERTSVVCEDTNFIANKVKDLVCPGIVDKWLVFFRSRMESKNHLAFVFSLYNCVMLQQRWQRKKNGAKIPHNLRELKIARVNPQIVLSYCKSLMFWFGSGHNTFYFRLHRPEPKLCTRNLLSVYYLSLCMYI